MLRESAIAGILKEYISLALLKGVDFAVCSLPEENEFHFFLPEFAESSPSEGCSGNKVFEIGRWLAPYSDRISIAGEVKPQPALVFLQSLPCKKIRSDATLPAPTNSTGYNEYICALKEIIKSCSKREGKTVFSRVICGELDPEATWEDIFIELCDTHPDTFRFIFHSEQTGAWMGATPETLLDVDFSSGRFATMAFAGTRKQVDADTPWDQKNIRENRFVSEFLQERIKSFGLVPEVSEFETVRYGTEIEHLCQCIHGNLGNVPYPRIIDAINPTPALCGTPKEAAIVDIERFERHNRGCYGGYVGLASPHKLRTFATLRCCHFSGNDLCIYAGGGITSDSVPEKEWHETEAKSTFFQRYLLRKV